MKYKLWWKPASGGPWEEIDEYETRTEAETMHVKYAIALGGLQFQIREH